MSQIRSFRAVYDAVRARTTETLDLSDLLRAEIVMLVSGIDYYVHEIVRLGMLECHRGTRGVTPSFLQFSVTLENVRQGLQAPTVDDWLDNEIRTRHGWQSFQRADKIAEAIRLFSGVRLWEDVGRVMGSPAEDVVRRLNLIVDRRNKIAHEADTDPTYGKRWPIDALMVDEASEFIEKLVEAIHRVVV